MLAGSGCVYVGVSHHSFPGIKFPLIHFQWRFSENLNYPSQRTDICPSNESFPLLLVLNILPNNFLSRFHPLLVSLLFSSPFYSFLLFQLFFSLLPPFLLLSCRFISYLPFLSIPSSTFSSPLLDSFLLSSPLFLTADCRLRGLLWRPKGQSMWSH